MPDAETLAHLQAELNRIQPPAQPRPTIGRMVHYYRQQGGLLPLGDPVPSVVFRLFGDGDGMHVGLRCLGEDDESVIHRGVPFSPIPRAGCWTWPPR